MVVASFHLATFPSALAATARVPVHRRALRREPGLRFGKVLGTGRGRTMTASADLRRWAVFATWDDEAAARRFVEGSLPTRWDDADERFDVLLRPLGAHGSWDGVDPIAGAEPPTGDVDGPVAVLTRATVRVRALPAFLRAVPPVDAHLQGVDGLLAAVGIGELPVGQQATFSLWRDAATVQRFAYRSAEHAEVVRRTRDDDWYGEEWFARFRPIASTGTWDGHDPLAR
ncbi:MAG: spheroidene monooxygenase [Acidimicrobiia bacterium]